MTFDKWTTQEKKQVRIADLAHGHLIRIIQGIEAGRLFSGDDLEDDYSAASKWLVVMKAEAIRRGLQWDQSTYTTIDLLTWLVNQTITAEGRPYFWTKFQDACQKAGVIIPTIDIDHFTEKPSYMNYGPGGTPCESSST